MPNLLKKIVATVTTVSCAVWLMGPGVAQAITAAELQTQIDALLAQLAELQAQLAELEGEEAAPAIEGCTITSFDRNLKQGMSGDDVKCLQIVLNSDPDTQLAESGVGSPGQETSYFGPLTKAAVIKFQEKYADEVLASWGLTKGTGFVGSTTRAKLNELLTAAEEEVVEEEEEEVVEEEEAAVPAEALTVALASDTPAARTVAKLARDVVFTKINFTAGENDLTISSITVTRGGISDDDDVTNIKLFDGNTQLGATQILTTATHQASFSGLGWVIPAGETKTLTIKATIGTDALAVGTGNTIKLGIASANDITASETLSGEFPIYGSLMTVASASAGSATTSDATPGDSNVLIGSTEQLISGFRFTLDSTESGQLTDLTVTLKGTSADDDFLNIKLFWAGKQVGETVAKVDANAQAYFDLSGENVKITAGDYEEIYVYADIKADAAVDADDTAYFVIDESADVSILGLNSGGYLTIKAASWPVGGTYKVTFKTGQLAITEDPILNPATTQEYVKGATDKVFAVFKISTSGSMEGVKIERLKVTKNATSGEDVMEDTDLVNLKAYVDDVLVAGPVSFSSGVATFIFSPTLDVPKGENKVLVIKGNISTGASANEYAGLYIDGAAALKVKGLESDIEIPTGKIDVSSVDTIDEVVRHKVIAKGSLAIGVSTLSVTNVSPGSTGFVFGKFTFTADSGEDIQVSKIIIKDVVGSNASSTDLSNIAIYDDTTQLGDAVSEFIGDVATFYPNWTIPAGETKTLIVKADVDTGISVQTSGETHTIRIESDKVTAKGLTSTETISASGLPTSGESAVTIAEGSITVRAASTPIASTFIKGEESAHVLTLYIEAGTAENVKLTYLKLSISSTSTLDSTSTADDAFSDVKLYDGAALVETVSAVVDSGTTGSNPDYVEFKNLALTISAGTTKALDVEVKVLGDSGDWYFGVNDASTDVKGIGLSSLKEITGNFPSGVTVAESQKMTLSDTGHLWVWRDPNTPVEANLAVGATGVTDVEALRVKMKALYETVKITKLIFDVEPLANSTSSAADFVQAKLYFDGVQQSPVAYPYTTGDGNDFFTFNFAEPYPEIAKNAEVTVALKVDLNGVDNGASSGYSFKLGLDSTTTDIIAQGAASGAATKVYGEDGATYSEITGYAQIERKVVPIVSYSSAGGSLAVGEQTAVGSVTVAAGSEGSVKIKALTVTVYVKGTVATDSAADLYLYDPAGNLVATTSYDDAAEDLESGDTYTLTLNTAYLIPADQSVTFAIKADTDGLINAGDWYRVDLGPADTSFADASAHQSGWKWSWYDGKRWTNGYKVKTIPITGGTWIY
jgi:peptidoglycan hydrolase-like protein with peptidoglycan-binding domain